MGIVSGKRNDSVVVVELDPFSTGAKWDENYLFVEWIIEKQEKTVYVRRVLHIAV